MLLKLCLVRRVRKILHGHKMVLFFFLRCVFLANLESHSEAEMVRVLTPYGIGSFTTSAHRQETVNLSCVGWWVLKETSGPEEVGGGGGVTGDVFPMKPPWKFFVS